MADFLTRLVERTWGVTPVVKSIITPLFSPENLPDKTPVGFDIEENSEQMTLTHPQLNSRGKSRMISSKLSTIPPSEQNSQSVVEVEDEFLIQNHSGNIQTSSRREASEQLSKISASQSSSLAISYPPLNPLSNQDKTQEIHQYFSSNLTQKDVPLIQSQNGSAVTVNQESRRFPQKSTQNPANYLDSQSKNGLTSSDEPTLLPHQNRVHFLEQHEVKKYHQQRQALNSSSSQKLSKNLSPEPSTQNYQKQQQFKAAEKPVPPTIKVKIGRIEVRANTPSPRTNFPVQSPKPPRLSLDEYLRSNSGGKP